MPAFSFRIALLSTLLLSGCGLLPVEPPPPPVALSEITPTAARLPVPAPAAEPLPSPPRPPPAPPAEPDPGRVVVLLPSRLNGFEPVLPYLDVQLTSRRFETQQIDVTNSAAIAALAAEPGNRPTYVIAVGSDAARVAIDDLHLPTIFCQIPDQDFRTTNGVYGVASMPPLELQLHAWKQLDPSLSEIGLILGRDEFLLAARARNAAEALGLSLELELASSDQEAVYLFKRMAPSIDGLWLLPDNNVLSPRALREMIDHANSRQIQSLAFTPALLEWGALLSVTGTPANIASTLASVVARIATDGDGLPIITQLSELEARVNPTAAARLGLTPASETWILRDGEW